LLAQAGERAQAIPASPARSLSKRGDNQRVFDQLDKPARGKTCEAIMGIIEEAKEIMEEFEGAEALDAGLAASAQAVEHYEIARYGTLKTWAMQLGHKDATNLLDQTLQEEIKTDKLLLKSPPRRPTRRPHSRPLSKLWC
jgi:ferritin-like metal-binding protein YciE